LARTGHATTVERFRDERGPLTRIGGVTDGILAHIHLGDADSGRLEDMGENMIRTRKRRAVAALVAGALVIAACGGDDDDSGDDAETEEPADDGGDEADDDSGDSLLDSLFDSVEST